MTDVLGTLQRGAAAHQAGQWRAARDLYRTVLAADPDNADALHLLGVIERRHGDPGRAVELIRRSLVLRPDLSSAAFNLANLLADLGRYAEAASLCKMAAALAPDDGQVAFRLGALRLWSADLAGAASTFGDLLSRQPDWADAWINLGSVQRERYRYADAEACHRNAVAAAPSHAAAWLNLGNALRAQERDAEAADCYRRAELIEPAAPLIGFNLAVLYLARGEFGEGWRRYESRLRFKGAAHDPAGPPVWSGEPLEGRRILVRSEQGFGDTLQFCRYVPLLIDRGAQVAIEAPKPLHRLLRSLRGGPSIVDGTTMPNVDFQVPMMSLPLRFGTDLETIPADGPYLSPDPDAVRRVGGRLAALEVERAHGPRVGLCWAGAARPHDPDSFLVDRRRSLCQAQLAPPLAVEGPLFVSLQQGGAPDPRIIDLMDPHGDFADTAALIANLDLVVTVDTAIAHLAGALGTPVWILSRHDGCWRWLRGRSDSPWYPTARLFRQERPGDWRAVLADVVRALDALV